MIEGYDEIISKFGLDPTELRTLVANEHTRQKDNGSIVFYREMYLPKHLLKGIWVKKDATGEEIGRFFADLGMGVPVRKV